MQNSRPRRKTGPPARARTTKVQCDWCNAKMLGKNIVRHCEDTAEHDYLAWTICGQSSVKDFFGQGQVPQNNSGHQNQNLENQNQNLENQNQNLENQNQNLENENENQNLTNENQNLTNEDENLENENPNLENENKNIKVKKSKKRMRDQTLFEAYGPLVQFHALIENLIKKVENAEQEKYLKEIEEVLQKLRKAEVEINTLKSKKKAKLEKIENLRKTLENAIEI